VIESKAQGSSPRRLAMNLLARREHSIAELKTKLAAKDVSPDDIEQTLRQLVSEGLASDQRFAEAFVAYRARRGQGPVRIRLELEQRGVADELITASLDSCGRDWFDLARKVREKRFGPARPDDYRQRSRQSRFLQYRGFTSEQIRQAFGPDNRD